MFKAKAEVRIQLEGLDSRKTATLKDSTGKEHTLPVYSGPEDIIGSVVFEVKKGKKFDHQGIKVELLGKIDIFHERNQTSEFISMSKDLEPPGSISSSVSIPFAFNKVDKSFETYMGKFCRVRYIVKATVGRSLAANISRDFEFCVLNYNEEPEDSSAIKMEVGIEECLHIEFEYSRQKYHLHDLITGKVYFLLVRIRIKHMELAIVRRETIGAGANTANENETIGRFVVMDGAPVRGESIPIRMYLAPFNLTPTYYNINNKFSVRYFLNLILIDEEDRRYFKQQEIIMWRDLSNAS